MGGKTPPVSFCSIGYKAGGQLAPDSAMPGFGQPLPLEGRRTRQGRGLGRAGGELREEEGREKEPVGRSQEEKPGRS